MELHSYPSAYYAGARILSYDDEVGEAGFEPALVASQTTVQTNYTIRQLVAPGRVSRSCVSSVSNFRPRLQGPRSLAS